MCAKYLGMVVTKYPFFVLEPCTCELIGFMFFVLLKVSDSPGVLHCEISGWMCGETDKNVAKGVNC